MDNWFGFDAGVISVGFRCTQGEELTWHELEAVKLNDLELFAPPEPPIVVRVAMGVIHHVVVDEVTSSDGCYVVNASTVKRIISRKTKSKQARRVWVTQSTPQTQASAP